MLGLAGDRPVGRCSVALESSWERETLLRVGWDIFFAVELVCLWEDIGLLNVDPGTYGLSYKGM